MGGNLTRILVAEDDDAFRAMLLKAMRNEGYAAVELEDGLELEDYLSLVRADLLAPPDLILTDLRMPGASGLDVIRRAREGGQSCPIVLLTAFPGPEVFAEAERIGRITVLGKPIELEQLTGCVADLVARAKRTAAG